MKYVVALKKAQICSYIPFYNYTSIIGMGWGLTAIDIGRVELSNGDEVCRQWWWTLCQGRELLIPSPPMLATVLWICRREWNCWWWDQSEKGRVIGSVSVRKFMVPVPEMWPHLLIYPTRAAACLFTLHQSSIHQECWINRAHGANLMLLTHMQSTTQFFAHQDLHGRFTL
jgi:hypothetical protein